MAMGKRRRHANQATMWMATQDLPRTAGHPFYARLNQILDKHDFDGYVEEHACLEPNCSDKLEENTGPIGSIFHAISILYCMTTSLAGGGTGLGTLGLHEHKLRDLATVIGFRDVRCVPIKDPFNELYELRR